MNLKRALLTCLFGLTLTLLGISAPALMAQAADPDADSTFRSLPRFGKFANHPQNGLKKIAPESPFNPSDIASAQTTLAQLPLRFIPNQGQTDPAVKFHVHSLGGSLFFSPQEVVFSLLASMEEPGNEVDTRFPISSQNPKSKIQNPKSVVRLTFDGANSNPAIEGLTPLPGGANFFLGNDPAQWQNNLPTYEGIVYRDLYLGIDLVYRGMDGQLKSEFVVAPGADPGQIRLRYEGAESLSVREDGALVIQTHAGELVEAPLLIYQEDNGVRREIEGRYTFLDEEGFLVQNPKSAEGAQSETENVFIAFEIALYDPTLSLIIDPELDYSTYLGTNSWDQGYGIAVDEAGNIYVAGLSEWTPGNVDAFITQLINTGGVYTYGFSAYLGGSSYDSCFDVAVDNLGNIYLTGMTDSSDFPIENALQNDQPDSDAFIVKIISATGVYTFGYSTYLGGSGFDGAMHLAVDSAGNAYVTGGTFSMDFPVWKLPQSLYGGGSDAFVTQIISSSGIYTYGYSTYLGGSGSDRGNDISADGTGNAYITGETDSVDFPLVNATQGDQPSFDAFVTQIISVSGVYTYGYSTYLGGNSADFGNSIAVDGSGNIYVTGPTYSSDFPTRNPLHGDQPDGDVFITQLVGTSGVYTYGYSTYLGGSDQDLGEHITVDNTGYIYLIGETRSTNFPLQNAIQGSYGGNNDAFVTQLIRASESFTYGYSTYLGGSNNEYGLGIVVDKAHNVYATGATMSSDFPVRNFIQSDQGGEDAFIAKISSADPALILTKTVTPSLVVPGQRITYSLILSNSSVASATNTVISDTLPAGLTFAGPVTLEGAAGYTGSPPTLASGLTIVAGTRITLTLPVTVNSGLANGLIITNTAAVTSAEIATPIMDAATLTVINNPIITVTKSANLSIAQVGQTITYTYLVTNTGNVTLTNLTATDDKLGQVNLTPPTLASNQVATGTLTYTIVAADLPGPLINIVEVSGTPPTGPAITATVSASVTLVPPDNGLDESVYLPIIVKNK